MNVAGSTITAALPAELAVVVPTFNEAANVPLLVAALDRALAGIAWEVVFVDDNSPDGTSEAVRRIAAADPRVRIVQRYGRRGLSTACIEGFLATAAPYLAVIDGDMQHDEAILAPMLQEVRSGDIDLVVGSRYTEGGDFGAWTKGRLRMSQFATALANRLTRTPISDPMSGFFLITRDAFMRSLPNLSSVGFKILLDIAASSPEPLRVAEMPYSFRTRQHGESKLDTLVLWEYLQLLLDKAFGHIIPARFISFALVGGSGVFVNFATFALFHYALGLKFGRSTAIAVLVSTTSNYLLNNMLTYRDQRLTGARLLWGWLTFNLVCLAGSAANVGVARWYYYSYHGSTVFALLAGIAITTVWNYTMTSIFTWRKKA